MDYNSFETPQGNDELQEYYKLKIVDGCELLHDYLKRLIVNGVKLDKRDRKIMKSFRKELGLLQN